MLYTDHRNITSLIYLLSVWYLIQIKPVSKAMSTGLFFVSDYRLPDPTLKLGMTHFTTSCYKKRCRERKDRAYSLVDLMARCGRIIIIMLVRFWIRWVLQSMGPYYSAPMVITTLEYGFIFTSLPSAHENKYLGWYARHIMTVWKI